MRLPIRLAWRYAWTRRNRSLTHLISGISMFVIAAVTAAMIAILSAFNGIESVVTELFGTLDAPVAVVPTEGSSVPNGCRHLGDGPLWSREHQPRRAMRRGGD